MSLDRYWLLLSAYVDQRIDEGVDPAGGQEVLLEGQHIYLWFVPCDADPDEARLMARTDVARLSGAPSTAVCRVLLQANAFWSGINAGALGLRGSDVVMLSVSRRIASLDADGLAELLQGMVVDARRWSAFLHASREPEQKQRLSPGTLA